jgi:DNA repair protein RecO (recombination protein O)
MEMFPRNFFTLCRQAGQPEPCQTFLTLLIKRRTPHLAMPPTMETTAAILLRKTRLSDTSLIITWCAEKHGKIKTVAKGARRPKSAFSGKLDLFFLSDIQFSRSRKSDLHILREVVLREPQEGIRQDYRRVQLASYFAELIDLSTESDHAVPELYDLLLRALNYLNTGTPTRRALLHFESELARLTGILDAGTPPATALGRALGRLPVTRGELVSQLA